MLRETEVPVQNSDTAASRTERDRENKAKR
jgi:hypothetical protein